MAPPASSTSYRLLLSSCQLYLLHLQLIVKLLPALYLTDFILCVHVFHVFCHIQVALLIKILKKITNAINLQLLKKMILFNKCKGILEHSSDYIIIS